MAKWLNGFFWRPCHCKQKTQCLFLHCWNSEQCNLKWDSTVFSLSSVKISYIYVQFLHICAVFRTIAIYWKHIKGSMPRHHWLPIWMTISDDHVHEMWQNYNTVSKLSQLAKSPSLALVTKFCRKDINFMTKCISSTTFPITVPQRKKTKPVWMTWISARSIT